jgi:hypothetical protein
VTIPDDESVTVLPLRGITQRFAAIDIDELDRVGH